MNDTEHRESRRRREGNIVAAQGRDIASAQQPQTGAKNDDLAGIPDADTRDCPIFPASEPKPSDPGDPSRIQDAACIGALPTGQPSSIFGTWMFRALLCFAVLVALFVPRADRAQSQTQQIQIIAGVSAGQEAVTCNDNNNVCVGDSTLGYRGVGCRTGPFPLPASPIALCNTGYGGDGGSALIGMLSFPVAVAADQSGNVYIADASNLVVRKVDPSGVISTYACVDPTTGAVSFSGCQLPPQNSSFWLQSALAPPLQAYPSALAIDANGNLKVGVINPGLGGTLAMASDPSGNVYALIQGTGGGFDVTITVNGSVFASTQSGTLPIDSTYAGLAADAAGNVYTIGTTGTYTGDLIKIAPGGTISIVVNEATQPLLSNMVANGLTMDATGNFYVLVNSGSLLEEYSPATQTWTAIAGTGTNGFNDGNFPAQTAGEFTNVAAPTTSAIDQPMPATSTDLNSAMGIALGPGGALYIADSGNNVVRRVGGHSGPGCDECGPTTLAITDQISRPLPPSWAFDPTLHKLYAITSSSPGVVTVFNTTNDTVADNITFGATSSINSIAVDSTNNFVYVSDATNNVVYVINAGADQQVSGSPVSLPGSPGQIAVLPDAGNSRAYVTIADGGYSYPSPSLPAVAIIAGPSISNPSASYVTGIGAYDSGTSLSGAGPIIADPQRDKVYVRYLGALGTESAYSFAQIDASSSGNNAVSTYIVSVTANFSGTIYSDSMAIDESTGNVMIADGYDADLHLFEYSSQSLNGFFGEYGGFYNYHVAADSVNGIFYTWDGYGNVGYIVPNQASGVITSTSVFGNSGLTSVAVDSSTEQAYVVNCATTNADGTLGTVTLWDGLKESAIATLPLEIPSTATSETCGSTFVDTSNSNPAAHSAWVSYNYGLYPSGGANAIDVINGPAPAARPLISISPSSLSFGTAGVGQGSFVTNVTIQNNGTGPLTGITPIFEDAQDPGSIQVNNTFSGPSTCGAPIAPGGSCVIFLQFTPSKVENFSGSILFLDNSPDTPQSISVTGTGVPAMGSLTISPLAFPPGVVGQAYSQPLSVSGLTGPVSLAVTSGSLPSGLSLIGLALTGTPTQAATYNFTITATDTATGRTGSQFYSLTITSATGGQTQVGLSGAGLSGVISFGSIEFDEPSATLQTQLEDTGLSSVYANLQVTGATLTGPNAGDFVESDTCRGQSIAEFSRCTINVSFRPTVQPTANEVAQLVLSSNAAIQPIFLTGTSAAPLGAPASLPVAVSVDNGNPPNLAAMSNAGGCYPPECGGSSGSSTLGAVSSGGKFVGFSFAASNLPGPPAPGSSGNPAQGAYLRNTCVGSASGCEESTQYISYGPTAGPAANSGTACNVPPSGGSATANVTGIDSTGQYVLFESNGCAFSGATSQNANQIFLRDVINGNTTLISIDPTNSIVLSNGASSSSMSQDARFFAFASTSTNADANFLNPSGGNEVYWRGCTGQPSTSCTPTTVVVSQDNADDSANDYSEQPSISANGRFVAFTSTATQLTELAAPLLNNVAGTANVFLWDSCAGTAANACSPHTILISKDPNGNAVGGTSASVSADGRFVAFLSSAPTLLPTADQAQYGGTQEVYFVDTCLSNGTQVSGCQPQPPILVSQLNGVPGDEQSLDPFISADGSLVLFSSESTTLRTQSLFNQSPVYKYTNCLSSAAPANCAANLQIISVDATGTPIQGVYSSGIPDPTGQYFIFGVENNSGGYTPSTEIYLGPTLAPLGPLTITTLSLQNAIVGTNYSQKISAVGAGSPATFAVTSGAQPTGLYLAQGGVLSGTPNTAGTYNFTITALGNGGQTAQQTYQVIVYPALSITPSALTNGMVGSNYSEALTATGGSGTGYTWNVTSGSALSAVGLNLSSVGLISGTPTGSETAAAVTIQVTDSQGNVVLQAYQLTVYPGLSIAPATLPNGAVGSAYAQALSATGGSGTGYAWNVTSGSGLSAVGLTLSPAGSISGTPTATESAAGVTVQVTDSAGFTAQHTYQLTVTAAAPPPPAQIVDSERISVSDVENFPDTVDNEPIDVTDSVSVVPLTLTSPIQVAAPVAYFTQGSPLGFNSTSQSQQVVGIENIGATGSSLTLTSAAISTGAPFTVSPASCFSGATQSAIPSGGFCTVTITYTGSSPTTDTGTLTFTDNAGLSNLNTSGTSPNFTQSITLNGAGGATVAPAAPQATITIPTITETIAVSDSETFPDIIDSEPITVTDIVSVKAGPIVTGVSPNGGPAAGGTSVTITGAGFTGATDVSFGTAPAASFTVNSDTQITATSPAGTGAVDITVVTPVAASVTSAADQFTYQQTGPVSLAGLVSVTTTGVSYQRVLVAGKITWVANVGITIQNVSGSTLNGPFEIAFPNLPSGEALSAPAGILNGSPYVTVPSAATLAPGQQVTFNVSFKVPSASLTFNTSPAAYAGIP